MNIKTIEITKINPAAYNPRKDLQPKDAEYQKLKSGIDKFDLVEPLVWNAKSGNLVGGHQRLKILQERGDTEVQVSVVDLDDADEKALNLALNKIGGDWDDGKLSELLGELSELPDFDIELTGFDLDEIAALDIERAAHDRKYKPGESFHGDHIDFITDEATALAADDDAKERFKDKSIILMAFSGGKDSSFALLWAKHNFPDKQIICIFADTGVEFPGITAHIKACADFFEVEYKIVRPEKDMWIEIEKDGWFPNIIYRSCQADFVYAPINKYEREFDPNESIIIDGSRGDQATRLTKKTKTSGSPDAKMKDYDYFHPVFDISRELQETILVNSGMPIWEGYSRGFQRTACWMCPGQNGDQALALSENYPGLVEDIRRWE